MKLTDHLKKENIFLDAALADKSSVLKYIADACARNDIVNSSKILHEGLVEREQTMSTGVGNGIGFPHTANPQAREAGVVLIRLATPIAFESLDNQPVDIVLGMIFPASDPGIHVRMLARVSRLCQNRDFLDAIRHAETADSLLEQMKLLENGTGFH